MKKLFVLIGALLVVACNDPVVCSLEQTANASIAAQLESLASCSNTSAITAQLQAWEAPLNLCPTDGKAKLDTNSAICDALLPIVETLANNEKYLTNWGCDLTKAGTLNALLTKACAALSPAPTKK